MAILKKISFGKSNNLFYWKVIAYEADFFNKTGVIVLGGYPTPEARERDKDSYIKIRIPVDAEKYRDGLTVPELYAIAMESDAFVEGLNDEVERTPPENGSTSDGE